MDEPVKLILRLCSPYGYTCYMAECEECGEEIEDVEGIYQCECGIVYDCELEEKR